MYKRFLQNHVLANIAFLLILAIGAAAYAILPRQQDPTINFNWIQVTTFFPGASAEDVETRITDPIEDAIRKIDDIRFVNSSSMESLSSILVRFDEIDERTFDKRLADLRREIQNKERELPAEVESPNVLEITTANGFPTAQIVVSGITYDENMRVQVRNIRKDLELIDGVSIVYAYGFNEPELQVEFIPERLEASGLTPTAVADAISASFRDVAAGNISIANESWLIRVQGTSDDPSYLAELPLLTKFGEVRLGNIAEVKRGHEEADRLASYEGQPAVLMSVMKSADTNTLKLIDRLTNYIEQRNQFREETGVNVVLVDDQTQMTRNALRVMQTNALLGLAFVMVVTWLFLGIKIAFFTSIAIPFILCGTFLGLYLIGQTLNVMVLLGIVISLGMLVDDAVVVVESIYYRIQRGIPAMDAAIGAVKEVFAPVTTSVLTTIAAFGSLMLLPGIFGKFMFVVPFVVTLALAISLLEAYWMLPAHIAAANIKLDHNSGMQKQRRDALHRIRLFYTRWLLKAMRYPSRVLGSALLAFILAAATIPLGLVKLDFFASDPLRLFYVNVTMPIGTPLETTLAKAREIEQHVRAKLLPGDARSVVSYSGLMITEVEPFQGDRYGQVVVSLNPLHGGMRDVADIVDELRPVLNNYPGIEELGFMQISGGPPTTKPITIKVRGDRFNEIRAAAKALSEVMASIPGVKDISVDDSPGQNELRLQLDHKAIRQAGLNPLDITRILRLYIDGEVVATIQSEGEKLDVRVRAVQSELNSIDALLRMPVSLPDGGNIPLGQLVYSEYRKGFSRIRHYNYRRSIEVSADINKEMLDEVAANQAILAAWNRDKAEQHPNTSLDTSGILDDIYESMAWMGGLLLVGLFLMYMILGTQFRSYFQPFLILSTIFLAFTGVVFGSLLNQNPFSLYTLFGVIALAGIAVNASIVLISAANSRLEAGMSILHATVYAARRRVVPIIITSLTTIAGLFSLAVGLGGYSLLWGPMAASIVWGLSFSTLLTLFVIPILYEYFMRFGERIRVNRNLRRIQASRKRANS